MGIPSMPELIIILVIIILLFGAKKIPDLAKGLGSGIKNFKKAMSDDDETSKVAEPTKQVEDAQKNATTTTTQENSKVS
jgi:sec-independent protein translocase protein TatA